MSRRPALVWINQFAILPSDGGGTRHFELSRELVKRGWDATVVASDFHLHRRAYSRRDRQSKEVVEETVDGVRMCWLWSAPYVRNDWRRAWNWLTFARSVMRDRRTLGRADVVIGSSPQLFAARAGRTLARSLRAPFVFEVRDLWPQSLLAAGGRKGPAYYLLDHVASSLYRDADRILVLAKGSADYLANAGVPRRKLVHVPNGVDVHTMTPAEASANGRPFTLVYAGAHGVANGLDQVLEAAALLRDRGNTRFILIGDGPEKARLREDAVARNLTNVEFLAPVGKQELGKVFASVDAGLMVLRDAPLFSFAVSPNKLFDYLAAGLPVVSNVPGEVGQMVAEAGAGVQASSPRGDALASAIVELMLRSPDALRAMRSSGRAWVEREHSREVLGARLDAALRALLPG